MKTNVVTKASAPVTTDPEASTRARVMESIMARGATTAAELASDLDLTAAAVRRHLATLTERGMIATRTRRSYQARGRGRPAKVYVPTDTGRADFMHTYDTLALELLDYLAQAEGPEAISRFAESRFAEMERRYADEMATPQDGTPAVRLAGVLSDDGFMATVQPVRSGEQLCQHHCPVSAVAEKYPEICNAETGMIGRLLGSHVQRLATIAHGDGVCTTHIPRPVTKEN